MSKQAVAVRLRPLEKEDLSRLVRWNSDPEVESLVGLGLPCDLAGCIAWWEESRRSTNTRLFALEDEKGQLIGDLELAHICWRGREAELRIRIGEKAYWNKGYGTLALKQIKRYAFDELGLDRLYLRVYTFNSRAIHCYQKLGFKKKAILKRPQDRDWKDIYLMTMENTTRKKEGRHKVLPIQAGNGKSV
ncbi:GNAT family N-acetyltransferase [Capillibacterium thermochitinicola]|uniref:GNAT family N-acetyltransferase n=1 Tax=Capillibacterium thermochitinicola TaxID=2699427 RepID=A0A8J6HXY2_9FIRM|nr:GNAT family N-acetyltransferase [Capillibacterium thermochitinicola]MBA2132040.1 GNAT family N-acetyltransferase [Capillibacterium thermochitinicola]